MFGRIRNFFSRKPQRALEDEHWEDSNEIFDRISFEFPESSFHETFGRASSSEAELADLRHIYEELSMIFPEVFDEPFESMLNMVSERQLGLQVQIDRVSTSEEDADATSNESNDLEDFEDPEMSSTESEETDDVAEIKPENQIPKVSLRDEILGLNQKTSIVAPKTSETFENKFQDLEKSIREELANLKTEVEALKKSQDKWKEKISQKIEGLEGEVKLANQRVPIVKNELANIPSDESKNHKDDQIGAENLTENKPETEDPDVEFNEMQADFQRRLGEQNRAFDEEMNRIKESRQRMKKEAEEQLVKIAERKLPK